MTSLRERVVTRWASIGLAGGLWWAGAASLATAAMLVLGATSLTPAPAQSATGMSGSSMNSHANIRAAAAPASATICSNVAGSTTMPNGMVMAPVPAGAPTPAQQAAADQLVRQTTASLAKFTDLSAATAAGYVPATNPNGDG